MNFTNFKQSSKSFGLGYGIQPKRNLNRFVKWPAYIRLQRQKKILSLRLKVPPSIAQFSHVLDKSTAAQAFKLLNNYRPETRAEKKARLEKEAAAVADGKTKQDASEKPYTVKYGLKHVVALIENKKPQLVLVADDVDPIELVVFIPALCRKVGVPYAIVKGKARLGTLVHKKTATVVALTDVRAGDKAALSSLLSAIESNYTTQHEESRKKWGGGVLGSKSVAKIEKRARLAAETLKI